ncbi:hypothetical protein DUI87_07013 [Hirundo rustica rustica]|uniref:ribonuclease H n=1 Tax=Hirundo rustica rustica TaxID=333673 RepID=A0A3M0L6I1_HIRRU|nr:hypothetical protein DUI87_07013 [Hirundo rustica rustica]
MPMTQATGSNTVQNTSASRSAWGKLNLETSSRALQAPEASADFMRQFFQQFSGEASEFQHDSMSSFSRIFLPRKGAAEKFDDAQKSLVPVLWEKEKETKQDGVQPQKWVDPGKDEATAKLQTQQSIPESDETQASGALEFLATDWTDISKYSLKGEMLPMGSRGIGGNTLCLQSEDAIVVSGPGDDAPRFAFSIPSVNREEPLQRYHWVVLPQGLWNSPTICQWFVARALSPAREKHPGAKIIHYMDDLLIAAPTQQELQRARDCVIAEVQHAGLEISTSKIQETAPWKYLGWKITEQTVKPQKIEIKAEVNNLQDLQQLLGEINWIRPILGITNDELASLFNLLKGDNNIKSPRNLTPEAREALEKIAGALQQRQAHHFVISLPFFLAVMGEKIQLYGLIFSGTHTKRPIVDFRVDFFILQVSEDYPLKSGDDGSDHHES